MISRCPFCAADYPAEQIRPLSGLDSAHLVHVECLSCHCSMLLSIVKREGGLSCSGVFTDCLFADAVRFMAAKPICVDDVILVHQGFSLDKMMVLQ